MRNTRSLVMSGMLIAIGCVLPPVIRMIPNGGVLFSPMHIPVLLAGLVLGPAEGMIVGIACPLLNYVIFGMPQGASLIGMCIELPVYGLTSGILMKVLSKQTGMLRVYLSLAMSMLVGRIAGGLTMAAVLGAGNYHFGMWVTAYFINTAPAILLHLILIPAVYFALKKAKLVNG